VLTRNIMGTGVLAAGLLGLATAADSEPPSLISGLIRYWPFESISYEFGSKFASGYFVPQGDNCLLVLMIAEKADPEVEPPPPSPTRLRIGLAPGQIAGVDSDEYRSLNFTCAEGAATLLVEVGERNKLVALQTQPPDDSIPK
jgi:hypothetical protein